MKKLATYLFCLTLIFAPMTSCIGPLSADKGQAMIAEIEAQVREGAISRALGDALIEQVKAKMDPANAGGVDWEALLYSLGGLGVSVLGALTGVRLTRGPAKPMDQSQAEILRELIAERLAAKLAEQEGKA